MSLKEEANGHKGFPSFSTEELNKRRAVHRNETERSKGFNNSLYNQWQCKGFLREITREEFEAYVLDKNVFTIPPTGTLGWDASGGSATG